MRLLDRTSVLLLLTLMACAPPAWAKRGDSARTAPSKEKTQPKVIELKKEKLEGRKTPELAKEAVVEKAHRHVADWLSQIRSGAKEPSLNSLKRLGVIGEPRETESYFVKEADETLYLAAVEVEINASAQAEMLRDLRLAEAWDRQLAVVKAFLGILTILACFAGYFWLEDISKGYYTHWLRLAVIGIFFITGYALVTMPNLRQLLAGG